MSDFSALVARLEGGQGPNRDLDAAIAQAVLGLTHDGEPEPYRKWTRMDADGSRCSGSDAVMIRPFTDSLDAAVDLTERLLGAKAVPDVIRNAMTALARAHHWHICFPDSVQIAQIPRAILAAMLRALARSEI